MKIYIIISKEKEKIKFIQKSQGISFFLGLRMIVGYRGNEIRKKTEEAPLR